jgi:hypothetical protein
MTESEATNKTPTKNGKSSFKKKSGQKSSTSVMSLNNDTAVPMLRLGANNNFDTFKKKSLSLAWKSIRTLVD